MSDRFIEPGDPQDFLGIALAAARDNVALDGGPFGAVLVTREGFVVPGVNAVTRTPDPTAHAEVEAIRAAATLTGSHDLAGSTLYASCAPCPMCLTAAMWAKVENIEYAATPQDAGHAGFNDELFYHEIIGPDAFHRSPFHWLTSIELVQVDHPDKLVPFEAWVDYEKAKAY